MKDSLERFINLAKKTGDKFIIHDSHTGESVVVMDFDEYESLVENNFQDNIDFEDFLTDQDDLEELTSQENSNWHHAGEVLNDKYNFPKQEEGVFSDEEFDFSDEPVESNLDGDFEFDSLESEPETSIEELPFDAPHLPETEGDWEEEPLPGEEPVFLEEPV